MSTRGERAQVGIRVIVSTHNRAAYVPDALVALARQDCDSAFEVIVVDNASTDDTAAVLEGFCSTDRRFRTELEPRLGLSCGKNAGIRLARAPLLLFTDDDMVADPHWIRTYEEFFERHRGDELVVAGVLISQSLTISARGRTGSMLLRSRTLRSSTMVRTARSDRTSTCGGETWPSPHGCSSDSGRGMKRSDAEATNVVRLKIWDLRIASTVRAVPCGSVRAPSFTIECDAMRSRRGMLR
jgi:glycosyltransferase involved in cell wall biosynthesis